MSLSATIVISSIVPAGALSNWRMATLRVTPATIQIISLSAKNGAKPSNAPTITSNSLIAKTEEFIRRNLAGQKTKQAKSRRTMLEKLERLDAVRADQSSGDFRLRSIERTGNHVLTVDHTDVGYPDKMLARDISFILRRGECLGIIGPNGSGKTTFLRTILNKIPSLGG